MFETGLVPVTFLHTLSALAELNEDADFYRKRNILGQRLSTAGYQFLIAGQLEIALEVMQTKCDKFPRSWNADDSLGHNFWSYLSGRLEVDLCESLLSILQTPFAQRSSPEHTGKRGPHFFY